MTIKRIPSNWSEPAYDVYCDPTSVSGATGTGTAEDPYVSLAEAITHINGTTHKKLGIRTGRVLDISSLVNLSTTAGMHNLTTKAEVYIGAWQVDSDTPTIFENAKLIGTVAGDWTQVQVSVGDAGADSGGAVIAAGGTFTASSTSGVWKYGTQINTAKGIGGIGCGSRDSITSVVTASSYKQHGRDAQNTEVGWLTKSGANYVVNTGASSRNFFVSDKQWQMIDGYLLVKSTSNPATRWGGVYVYDITAGILHINECPLFTFEYAFASRYVGKPLQIRNQADTDMAGTVRGLWGSHVARPWSTITDQLSPTFSGGTSGTGSIDMTAGTNATVFGDGTSPWITVDMVDIDFDHIYSCVDMRGWTKNSNIHDIKLSMGNLQHNGTLFTITCFAPMGSHNEMYDFNFDRVHCGAGKFGRTDTCIDVTEECGGFAIHDGKVTNSAGTIQMNGSRRNQTCYRVLCRGVLRGPNISDGLNDGNGSFQVTNCGVRLDDPANWAIGSHAVAGQDWTKALAYDISADFGFPAKGAAADTDTMSKNDGALHTNNWAHIGDCPAASAYGFRNGTINTSATEGPWHAVGGVGTTANNGETVTLNQQQVRAQVLATIANINLRGFDAAKRVVDEDYADASGTQTVTALTTTDPELNGDSFPTSSSPTTFTIEATILNATTVDTTIDYTRVATNVRDMRKIPRWSTKASVGPIQYIPLSPTTRAL